MLPRRITTLGTQQILRNFVPVLILILGVNILTAPQMYAVEEGPVADNCNAVHSITQSLNGTVKTLRYPDPYPKSRHCSVQLEGDATHRVLLVFDFFYLYHPLGKHHHTYAGCNGLDNLKIYDGLGEDAKILGEYCGGSHPLPLMSSGQHLLLRLTTYTSDATDSEVNGYSARYYFLDNFGITSGEQKIHGDCKFEYNSKKWKEGSISSPNPNGTYPRNTNCSYIFTGTFLERVYLNFHHFDLEGIEPCTERSGSDFLEFSSLPGFDPCPSRRCGRFHPQEVLSEGRYFRVTFKSNGRLNGLGFSATYKFLTDEELPEWASYLKSYAGSNVKAILSVVLPICLTSVFLHL